MAIFDSFRLSIFVHLSQHLAIEQPGSIQPHKEVHVVPLGHWNSHYLGKQDRAKLGEWGKQEYNHVSYQNAKR